MSEIKPYRYFDTPDGQDTFKKLWCVLKPSIKVAAALGTADIMLYTHPKGYMATLARYGHVGWPILASTSTFVCATNMSANLRGKDDVVNWFIGGFAAGSVFGLWTKRTIVAFNMGMFLGILAVIKKHAYDNGWRLNPPDNIPNMWMGIRDFDWTLTQDRPGNWTTGK